MNLDKAIRIAVDAHTNQVDKGGESYILHPLRLMMQFDDDDYRIVAVLHDVIEDSHIALCDLEKEGFSDKVLLSLSALTRRNSQTYDNYISRISSNYIARKVKIKDLKDNLNVLRLSSFNEVDAKRQTNI